MQRVRSSGVAQGSEYFSIYLGRGGGGLVVAKSGEAGHADKKGAECITG